MLCSAEAALSDCGINLMSVRGLVAEVFRPAHFYLADGLDLEFAHLDAEATVWEIYRGHLLDDTQTRSRQSFET